MIIRQIAVSYSWKITRKLPFVKINSLNLRLEPRKDYPSNVLPLKYLVILYSCFRVSLKRRESNCIVFSIVTSFLPYCFRVLSLMLSIKHLRAIKEDLMREWIFPGLDHREAQRNVKEASIFSFDIIARFSSYNYIPIDFCISFCLWKFYNL